MFGHKCFRLASVLLLGWLAGCLSAVSSLAADALIAKPIVLNDNGGWSWFEDERAIIDPVAGKLLVSSIAISSSGQPRHGDVDVAAYDLASGSVTSFVLRANLQADDHNSASLYRRPDGRYLALYSKHGNDTATRYRISTNPGDIGAWGSEQIFTNAAGTTYSNLHFLPQDSGGAGRLYNFTRTVNYDPNVLVSSDQGSTWTYGGKLLTEGGGGDRPYVRYFSNGDAIHLITTQRHPRDFDNGVFHGYIRNGQLFGSAGNLLDANLFDTAAVAPSALTPILPAGTVIGGDAMRRGWTVDVAIDPVGNPVAVHQARANGDDTDHRFFYSRWTGTNWQVNPLGYAGSYLYAAENDYTGLVAIDPDDVNTVYVSSEVHPVTQAQLIGADGQRHYELFRGVTADGGATWAWTPLTFNSTVDNLRPIVPKWDANNTAVLWMRGDYRTYVDYSTEVVGLVNPPEATLTAALAVDFGATGQELQQGFQGFTRSTGTTGPQTESFASSHATNAAGIEVTLSGSLSFADLGNDVAGPIGAVVDDFVAASGPLRVTIANLAAGNYQLVIYSHHRTASQLLATARVDGRLAGEITPTFGVDPAIGVASARYELVSDGVSPVVLSLDAGINGMTLLNGLELFAAYDPFVSVPADLNADGQLDLLDYGILTQYLHTSFAGLTSQQAYARGDLNGDLVSTFADFVAFRNAYDDAYGLGALAAALTSVPEPHTILLLVGGLMTSRTVAIFSAPRLKRTAAETEY